MNQTPGCVWCGQTDKPNAYVLPLKKGQRKFCSPACLCEFRKGACTECGDAIPGPPVQITHNSSVKDFCSENCLTKHKKDNSVKEAKEVSSEPCDLLPTSEAPALAVPTPPSAIISGSDGLVANSNSFSWEDYLAETRSTAAPQKCFKQVR